MCLTCFQHALDMHAILVITEQSSVAAKEFLSACFCTDPNDRPSARELMTYSWICKKPDSAMHELSSDPMMRASRPNLIQGALPPRPADTIVLPPIRSVTTDSGKADAWLRIWRTRKSSASSHVSYVSTLLPERGYFLTDISEHADGECRAPAPI